MPELRWTEEMEEAMELLYRLVADHGGRLPESEALDQIGDWIGDAAKRAESLWWLAITGSPPVLKVTYGGRKALDAALASREAAPVRSRTGSAARSCPSCRRRVPCCRRNPTSPTRS